MEDKLIIELLQKLTEESSSLKIWIPAIVSIVTLVINLLFYIFVQPHLTYRAAAKESLTKTAVKLLNYMTEIVSFESFDGVPTNIRKYSMQIHLQFKSGTADHSVELLLEQIFQEVKKRKEIVSSDEIDKWNDNFRVLARELRRELAKYIGEF